MAVTLHRDLVQGTEEWFQARCGLITASEMHLLTTPKKLAAADNDDSRSHLLELCAQRVTRFVEPTYTSSDMERGNVDEIEAVRLYSEHFAPTEKVGFITNDRWGYKLGYSPDAIVGDKGLLECKSRKQKYQLQTLIEHAMPAKFLLQVQSGLWISEREWLDFISYSAGLPMLTLRIWPDEKIQVQLEDICDASEAKIKALRADYDAGLITHRLNHVDTKRPEMEMDE